MRPCPWCLSKRIESVVFIYTIPAIAQSIRDFPIIDFPLPPVSLVPSIPSSPRLALPPLRIHIVFVSTCSHSELPELPVTSQGIPTSTLTHLPTPRSHILRASTFPRSLMADEDHSMNTPGPHDNAPSALSLPTVEEAAFHIQQLRAALEQTQISLASTQAQLQTITQNQNAPRSEGIRFNKPPEFHGNNRALAYDFLVQVENHFASLQFTSDEQRVRWVHSFLRGEASKWFQPYLANNDSTLLRDWPAFRAAFLETFGDPQRAETVATQLFRLRQTSSVNLYAAEFFRLAADLKWDEQALMARFLDGLKPQLRAALAVNGAVFNTTREMRSLAAKIDHALFVNGPAFSTKPTSSTLGVPGTRRLPTSYAPGAPVVTSAPVPMDVDAQQQARGPLTPQERLRRQQEGLCFYCAGKHVIAQCPVARPRTARIHAIEDGQGEDQAQTSL